MLQPSSLDLAQGLHLSGLTINDLWLRYIAIGGTATLVEVDVLIHSGAVIPDYDHNLIAHALNEAFVDRGQDHPVAYQHTAAPTTDAD